MKVNCDIPVLMSDNEKIINSDEFSVQIIIFMSAGCNNIILENAIVKRWPANISRWSDFPPKAYCISFVEFIK